MKVQPPAGTGHDGFVEDAYCKTVPFQQMPGEGALAQARADAGLLDQGLGRVFQLREVILPRIERIAHAFQHRARPAMGRAGAGHAAGQIGGRGIGLAIGLIEPGKGFGDARMRLAQLIELDAVELHAGEQRVGGRLAQIGQ